jgi:hypothetical protein
VRRCATPSGAQPPDRRADPGHGCRGGGGTGIADLLAQNPDVSAQLAESQNRGALVDGYT